jgi:hypothetical protein
MRQSFGQSAGAHLNSLLNMSPLLWLWRSPFLLNQKSNCFRARRAVLIAVSVFFAVRNQAGVKRAYQRHSPFAFYVRRRGHVGASLGPAPTLRSVTFWWQRLARG